jgi:acetyl esterase
MPSALAAAIDTTPQALAASIVMTPLSIAGPTGPLDARLYRKRRHAAGLADTLLVFFHAGGFVSGSLEESDPCMRELALHLDAVLLAPTYAQAPDQPFPAAAEDAYAAIKDCVAHPRRYQWSGKHLVVGGVEAGGNLAAVAALMARDRGGPPLAAQMLMLPMLDPGLTSSSMRCAGTKGSGERIASLCAEGYREYLPRAADRMHPYASPLASTRLKGLPRTMMVSIDGDPLADEANAYADKLEKASVAVERLVLRVAANVATPIDANVRCQASTDGHAFEAMAAFVSSISKSAS